jgi:drug/metabolite transporter (DMT)-like permease
MRHITHSPLANVLLFSVFWALEIFTAKLAFLSGAQVVQFSIQSFFVALITLFIIILPKKINQLTKIPFSVLKWIILASAILMGVGGFLGNVGILLTTAVNAGFLTQFATVTTTFFAWVILKERVPVSKVIAIVSILLGTFLLVTKGQLIIPRIGDIFIILACVAWGFGPVLIKKMIKHASVDPDIASFFRPAAGIPVILFFVLLAPLYPSPIREVFQVNIFEVKHGLYVLLNGLLLALTWFFVNRTLRVASVSYTALLGSVTPILVALLALNFLNEKLELIQFVGILFIVASGFITQFLKFDKH